MSQDDYISDHESDFDDDIDDVIADALGGKDDSETEDAFITPVDPDEGEDDESEADGYESEPEKAEEPDLSEEEEEPFDPKTVSKYNRQIIVVKPENRRTSSTLSKFEMTEIVSIRATQISRYNNCMVDIKGLDDPILMAQRELMMRKCPLVLRRSVGERKNPKTGAMDMYMELWSPNEMQMAISYPKAM